MGKKFTLITGSSMGIGRSLALECAARGMNVLLVALEENLLADLAENIRRDHGVDADYLCVDLTDEQAARSVYDWCVSKGYQVNMLLSNAGIGMSGLYEKNPLDKYRRLILLNCMAAAELTHHFLPMLKEQGEAWVLYTGSLESTIAVPYKAAYTASKHFLYGFSLALGEELREFGIQVSILCPGPVTSNEGSLMRMKSEGKLAQLLAFSPEEVAPIAINGLLNRRRIIVPGALPSFIEVLALHLPRRLKMKILHRVFLKFRDIQG